tara:strand:- start:1340 stop:2074 length:735 start_codon:yes stop_codon:yes gene_type:complete
MGKMTYKRRKNVKKQSFKKRKNKKMKGGDATDTTVADDPPEVAANATAATPEVAATAATPEVAATAANTEGDPTGAKTEGDADPDTAAKTDEGAPESDATVADDPPEVAEGAPESDAGYVQFLEELKENPGKILRKKVYVWHDVSEIYIYNTAANKWENKIDDVTEDANTTPDAAPPAAPTPAANTTTEGAAKTDANADDAAKTAVVPDDKTDTAAAASVVHEGDANTGDDTETADPAPADADH